jgi:hypothetical protein
MRRTLFNIAVVAVLAIGGASVAAGCSANGSNRPYGLTGNPEVRKSQGELNRAAADQKYRATPGWRTGVQVPANYPS